MSSTQVPPNAPCPVCRSTSPEVLRVPIFGDDRSLHQCPSCEAAFYENPGWLDTAYSSAISSHDTGIVERCIDLANVLTPFLWRRRHEPVIDFGGGIGLLSRIMRDRGFDFHSVDPMAEYRLPLPTAEVPTASMVTMVEVLEHLTDPVSELRKIAERAPIIFISTHLIPAGGVVPDWHYLQPETGQHIFFCTTTTLRRLASELRMNVTSNGKNLHVLHRSHLSWRQRLVVKFQQPAWVLGNVSAMFSRGRSRAAQDAVHARAF